MKGKMKTPANETFVPFLYKARQVIICRLRGGAVLNFLLVHLFVLRNIYAFKEKKNTTIHFKHSKSCLL